MDYIGAVLFGVFLILLVIFLAGLIMYESDSYHYRSEVSRLGGKIMKYTWIVFCIIVASVILTVAINLITWGLTRGEI